MNKEKVYFLQVLKYIGKLIPKAFLYFVGYKI